MNNLGRVYSQGPEASHNDAEAVKWYRTAAGQGVPSAAFELGLMYDLGHGVPQSFDEALKWYQKAADAGYAPAFTNIGILYYNAQGVKRDLEQSYIWLSKAQKMGDPRAAELIPVAQRELKKDQRQKADAEIAQWQPPAAKPSPQLDPNMWFAPPPTATSPHTTQ